MEELMQTPTQSQTLFSRRVPAGMNRGYFFNVMLSQKGSKYLTITESRKSEGVWKSYKILVFQDSLNEWQSGLQEAIEHIAA